MSQLNVLPASEQRKHGQLRRIIDTCCRDRHVFGITVEADAVRAVHLRHKGSAVEVVETHEVRLEPQTIVDHYVEVEANLVTALRELRNMLGKVSRRAWFTFAASDHSSILKRVSVNSVDPEESLLREIECHIPFDDMWVGLERTSRVRSSNQIEFWICAVKADFAKAYVDAFRQSGIWLDAIEPMGRSLHRCFGTTLAVQTMSGSGKCVVLVHVGEDSSTIVTTDGTDIDFYRTITIGTAAIVEEIQKQLNVSREDAEKYFNSAFESNGEKTEVPQEIGGIIASVAGIMAGEYQRSMNFWLATTADFSPEKILITGKGARLAALRQAIAAKSCLPIETLATGIEDGRRQISDPALLPAFGLALRTEFTAPNIHSPHSQEQQVAHIRATTSLAGAYCPSYEEIGWLLEVLLWTFETNTSTIPQTLRLLGGARGCGKRFRRSLVSMAAAIESAHTATNWPATIADHLVLSPVLDVAFRLSVPGHDNDVDTLRRCLTYHHYKTALGVEEGRVVVQEKNRSAA